MQAAFILVPLALGQIVGIVTATQIPTWYAAASLGSLMQLPEGSERGRSTVRSDGLITHTSTWFQVQRYPQAIMAATSFLVWACLERDIHHHGCGGVAGLEAWWLGSSPGCSSSLGISTHLQPLLEPTIFPEASTLR